MRPRRDSALGLAAAQGLGTVCGCLLAFLVALSLTLFREGFYLQRLEQSGTMQKIYENVLEGGHQVAAAAGLPEEILDSLVSYDSVRTAVIRRADEIWHGATSQPVSPYADAVAYLQDTITARTGQMWNETDTALYRNVQLICDDMWRTNAVPPLSNLLNLLMQYRRIAWAPMAVLAVLVAACLCLLFPFSGSWKQVTAAVYGLGAAILIGSLLGMLVLNFCGWQNWMPAADPGYPLYESWFGTLPGMTAACGCGLAGLVWLAGLYPFAMGSLRGSRTGHRPRRRVQ